MTLLPQIAPNWRRAWTGHSFKVQPGAADIAGPSPLRPSLPGKPIVTSHRLSLAVAVLGCCLLGADASAMPLPAGESEAPLTVGGAGPIRLAQAQQAPQSSPSPTPDAQAPAAAAPADQQNPADEPIGNVASLTGIVTVVRNKDSIALKLKDDIYLNDAVQTAASSSLGITFNDGTTFHLTANAKITIDNYVYEDGGSKNAGAFDIAKGTVAFVAAAVAKTGNMQITTPTSTANNVNIKLYPDADGHVGRIEINDRQGARLGALTQGASGFAIRPGTGGARFAAVPITISPQQQQRDQGFVRQVHATQTVGRQIVTEQRALRRANPPQSRPGAPVQPGPSRPGQPGTPQQPGQNRPGQPGTPRPPGQNRPGQPGTPQQPGQNRPGQPHQPGTPNNRQGQEQPQQGNPRAGQNTQPANPAKPGTPSRAGQNAKPANPAQPTTPSRAGQNARPETPAEPGAPVQPNAQPRTAQPAPPPLPRGQPLLHQGGRPQPRPGAPKPRQAPPAKDKRKK